MELLILLLLFVGGIITGLYAGNVGGGGLVTFPLLILIGLPTHIAIATNRLSVVLLEGSSALKFGVEKKLNLKIGILLGCIAALGSIIGSYLVLAIDPKYLDLIIALVMFIMFIILYNKDKLGIKEKTKKISIMTISITSFFMGIYGGFFGAGFGTFIMFLLIIGGYTLVKSAGIGRVVGLIMSAASAAIFMYKGLPIYSYSIVMGLGCAIGSWIGIGVALKKGNKFMKVLFIIIILLTIGKLVLGFFGVI